MEKFVDPFIQVREDYNVLPDKSKYLLGILAILNTDINANVEIAGDACMEIGSCDLEDSFVFACSKHFSKVSMTNSEIRSCVFNQLKENGKLRQPDLF